MKTFDQLPNLKSSEKMPTLFIGHGSPMNAISENRYTQTLKKLGEDLPRPQAILVVSAHWMTEGTWITGMPKPKTIHDFYGFPQALFDVQYPAPGQPQLAEQVERTLPDVHADTEAWGLDHGTWSVLRHMYPEADIPVVQLSLYMAKPAEYHFELGRQLRQLRNKGVLILGSGNLVHNLGKIRWSDSAEPYDWAIEFDEWLKAQLLQRNVRALMQDFQQSEIGRLSVPTLDHYLPMLYVLGAADEKEELSFEYESVDNGSISMRSFKIS